MKPEWQRARASMIRTFFTYDGKPFWQVKAAESDPKAGELLIYGPIFSEAWFDDDVSPGKIRQQLEALGDISQLKVFINSPGGDAFSGTTIHNILKRHPAEVVVYVDGLAASAASIIAAAGDRVIMPRNAMIMVHDPWTIALGNARELRKTADTLDQVGETIIASYQNKTGLSRRRLLTLMSEETWMGADLAKELGFADEIEESKSASATMDGDRVLVMNGQRIDLSWFENPPKLQAAGGPPGGEASTTDGRVHVTVNLNVSQPPPNQPAPPPQADPPPATDPTPSSGSTGERPSPLSFHARWKDSQELRKSGRSEAQ